MLDELGEETWRGKAYDVSHAEEKCFFDESPGTFEKFTLQYWGNVKLTRQIKSKGWKTIYKNETLTN
jgi:hypothetical protein